MRPFATQLSATPPERQRFFDPVRTRTCRAILSMISSVTDWIDAARSMCRSVIGDSGLRGGPPNNWWNFSEVMVRPAG